CARWLLFAYW
nr:immunoglobulin heavy chain junction region [Mus musculus]